MLSTVTLFMLSFFLLTACAKDPAEEYFKKLLSKAPLVEQDKVPEPSTDLNPPVLSPILEGKISEFSELTKGHFSVSCDKELLSEAQCTQAIDDLISLGADFWQDKENRYFKLIVISDKNILTDINRVLTLQVANSQAYSDYITFQQSEKKFLETLEAQTRRADQMQIFNYPPFNTASGIADGHAVLLRFNKLSGGHIGGNFYLNISLIKIGSKSTQIKAQNKRILRAGVELGEALPNSASMEVVRKYPIRIGAKEINESLALIPAIENLGPNEIESTGMVFELFEHNYLGDTFIQKVLAIFPSVATVKHFSNKPWLYLNQAPKRLEIADTELAHSDRNLTNVTLSLTVQIEKCGTDTVSPELP